MLMDQGSHETVAMLVAAGYVEPAATALLEVLRTTEVWEMRLLTLERAAEWKWSGDGSAVAGKQACDAAVAVVRFVLDEMTKPATHGAQRRPLALTLAMVLGQIGRGGADPADIAMLPVAELAALGSAWSEKKNAAAENSALLQAVAALRRRVRVDDSEMDAEALELDRAVQTALLSGLSAEKEESKESALECLVDYLDSSRAPTRDLLLRAVSVGGAKGPPSSLWALVQRSLASAARADPGLALASSCWFPFPPSAAFAGPSAIFTGPSAAISSLVLCLSPSSRASLSSASSVDERDGVSHSKPLMGLLLASPLLLLRPLVSDEPSHSLSIKVLPPDEEVGLALEVTGSTSDGGDISTDFISSPPLPLLLLRVALVFFTYFFFSSSLSAMVPSAT